MGTIVLTYKNSLIVNIYPEMGKRIKYEVTDKFKQKNPRNKDSKTILVFDEAKRVEYLTGFRKRKAERKRIAHEKNIQELKEEKQKIKQKRREMKAGHYDTQTVPEVEHLIKREEFDLPEHTVAITDVSEVDFVGNSGLHLGLNVEMSDEEKPENEEDPADKDKKSLSKKQLKHLGNEKVFKPEWKRHKNVSHLMNHKNKRINRLMKRKNADKATSRKKKKKTRNKPE